MEDIKILYLPLKKEWYDMHEKGIKTEDYREIKPYWIQRFIETNFFYEFPTREELIEMAEDGSIEEVFKDFDAVKFSYGYTKKTMLFECKEITIGKGNPEWGAPEEEVFIVKRGLRLI